MGFARPFLRKPVVASPVSKTVKQVILGRYERQHATPIALDRGPGESGGGLHRLRRQIVWPFAFDPTPFVVTFEQWSSMATGERVALSIQRLAELAPTWAGTHLGLALTSAAEGVRANAARGRD